MKKFDTVIFDLDGTLLNTLEDLADAVNYALALCEMPERTLEEVRQFVGNGIRKLMRRAVPEGEANPEFEKAFEAFRAYYREHCNEKTKLYPGVAKMLAELKEKGYHLAIVSNKADFAVQELRELYFGDVVETAVGEREGIARKPAKDMVEQVMREMGVTSENAVYVGDSDVDIQTAANSGIPCISVTWGFRDKEFLREHGAVYFADYAEEVVDLVEKGLCSYSKRMK